MNTTTALTPTEQEAFDELVHHFKGWPIPKLADIRSFNELIRRYAQNTPPGHFYDPETKRWFGTRNPHLAAPGVTVECQTKAPEGVPRYSIAFWVVDDNGNILPTVIARRDTLGKANNFARAVHAVWGALR